jgi:hypothetical protein
MLPHREQYLAGPNGQPVEANGERLLATHYAATNGDFSLTVRAGLRRGPSPLHPQVSRGIPYGGLARLLLCHVITEAKKRDTRTIDLGSTISAFCDRLDITPSGGAHGRLRYVVDQLQRLATCVVTFEWESLQPGRSDLEGENLLVVDSYHFWHRDGSPTQEPASGGTITLGGRFWNEVVASCFPLDLRKAQFFRAHPTAYDLYLWLTYKLGAMERSHQAEVALNYDALHAQLGSHYQTDADGALTPRGKKDFGQAIRHALHTIRLAWPTLDVSTPRGRLVLRATGPDVAHRAAARRLA